MTARQPLKTNGQKLTLGGVGPHAQSVAGSADAGMSEVFDIISRLRSSRDQFPKRERRVADFVLTHLDEVVHLRQGEIADAADVSVATVNRFCHTLGCDGFREFKIRLAQSVAVSLQYLHGPSDAQSPTDQLVGQVFGALVDTLNLARGQLDHEALASAIISLSGARRVAFFGVGGGSSNVAREGANRFFRLGIAAEAHSDGYLQRMLASTYTAEDRVFAISSTGMPAELLDSVAIARQYGAQTLALTKSGSDLAKAVDIAIEVDLPEDQDIFKPTASRLVFTTILDVLATGVARTRPEPVKENLRRIRTSLVPLSGDTGPKPVGD